MKSLGKSFYEVNEKLDSALSYKEMMTRSIEIEPGPAACYLFCSMLS